MTKEQEEVINRLNKDKNKPLACGDITIVNVEDIETVLNMLKEKSAEIQQKNTELAEKSAEIEELKQALARNIAKNFTSSMKESAKSKEDLEMLNKGWQIEIEKKDRQINSKNGTINALQCALKERTEERDRKDNIITKQNKIIDLMAKKIFEEGIVWKDKEEVKQYFERKSEE